MNVYSGSEQLGVVQLQVIFSSGSPVAVILYSASTEQTAQERIFSLSKYDLMLSRRLNSIKSSRAASRHHPELTRLVDREDFIESH
jgi:hypothetical protein